jgi:hypothetical protein
MPKDEYAIILSGERFIVTRDQLESEPGNYFASYFLGGFEEACKNTREISIQKDPLLFTLIQAHLRGYSPFPIPAAFIPGYMTRQGALENLVRDAQFFGLSRLEILIKEEMQKMTAESSPSRRVYQLWASFHFTH